ncbi:peptidylprolyl isomerase [Tamlana sp. I1]|uniref:peptidylprolyl isomerase n=1 Tax=Tamlana sp. I1 TaxID=2762061 RepID=UPI00188DEF89|nr:peptidylprolyl isomerase [Tamlana sp. I1]
MKLKHFFTLLSVLFVLIVQAQTVEEEVLFTVGDESVYASEFIRVYQKNLDLVQDESQKNVDEYLKLFTSYKLKIQEARSLGFHEKQAYQKELESYKKQLAQNYISESKVTEALVEEAYERLSYDVNADHILVKLSANALPQDTLAAYNEILKIRDRALSEGFEKVRSEVHNGKTIYGEKLGYFSGFKMVYEFESAAYNTKVGEISMPFRSSFGYHIVKVNDKRKSEGEREVAHIMILTKPNDTDSIAQKAEQRINEIYKKLNQGEAFEDLAKQFSEDKNSAAKGGALPSLSRGQLSVPEFEDVAFSLENVGDVSTPFQSKFGWHIVKLNGKKFMPDFETMKPELIEKVKRDPRSKLIDEALVDNLKKKYGVTKNQPALAYFESILNDSYFKNGWAIPNGFKADDILVVIGDAKFKYKDFADYLLSTQNRSRQKMPIETLVDSKYEEFLKTNLMQYQEAHLESENPEYANIISEYRDGLLLFELMENTIWNTAKTDSIAIRNHYDSHKESYMFPERIDAVIASSSKKKTLKQVAKLLKQNTDLETIKSQINKNDTVDVIFTSGIMDESHQGLPKDFQFQKGVSKILKHNGGYVVVQVKDILPASQKSFEDSKGAVVNDYQTIKEQKWIDELGNKYEVTVNQEVFEKVKDQLK